MRRAIVGGRPRAETPIHRRLSPSKGVNGRQLLNTPRGSRRAGQFLTLEAWRVPLSLAVRTGFARPLCPASHGMALAGGGTMHFLIGGKRTLLAVTLVLCFSSGGAARADVAARPGAERRPLVPYQPPPPHPIYSPAQSAGLHRAQPSRSWYGYQIMLADLASIGMGLASESAKVALTGYFVAPILTHAVHRRPVLAVASPIMRIMLPALGVGIGSALGGCDAYGEACGLSGAIYGGALGIASAMIVDWSWSWSSPDSTTPPPPADELEEDGERSLSKSSGLAIATAGFAPNRTGMSFVLGGQF